MKSKNGKRRVTLKEIIIVCVLFVALLLGVYFAAVYYPLSQRTSKVEADLDNIELYLDAAELRKAAYDTMKAENERIKASGNATEMPRYNGNEQQERLNERLTEILVGVQNLRFDSSGVSAATDGVRIRTVTVSFTAAGENGSAYTKAKSVLHELMNTGYRCCMTSLTLSPSSGDLQNAASVGVSCSVNFYEIDS